MNIAIIEKNKFYRESLKTVLDQIMDFTVVLDSDNMQSLFTPPTLKNIDLVLIDYKIIDSKTIDSGDRDKEFIPDINYLVMTDYDEFMNSEKWEREASNFIICKNITKQDLERKIRSVVNSNAKSFPQ